MNYPRFWIEASPRRKRIYSISFVFILAVLATLIGLLVPVSQQEAELISNQLNQTVTQGRANGTLIPDIFLNNFPLCLLMFIPLIGFGIGMFILFSTGQAFRAIFEIQAANIGTIPIPSITPTPFPSISPTPLPSITPATAVLALGLIGLVFLLEYVSYSIAMAESIWLFRRLLQWLSTSDNTPEKAVSRTKLKEELKYLLIFVGIVALLLAIGAVVETFTLSIGV